MIINTSEEFPLFTAACLTETQGCSLSSLLIRPTVRKETGSPLPVWDPDPYGLVFPTSCSLPRRSLLLTLRRPGWSPARKLTSKDRKLISASFCRSTCGTHNRNRSQDVKQLSSLRPTSSAAYNNGALTAYCI